MPYDEQLAQRVRKVVATADGISERKMMGGLCFMVDRHMFAGVHGDDLFVKMEPEQIEQALRRKHTQRFKIGARTTRAFVLVQAPGVATARSLRSWLEPALDRARNLPPKP